jgi:hypothetical protein
MKDVYLFLIGFTLGISSFFLLVFKITETSDIINVISIFVNIGIAVFVAYFIQNRITNNRYVKEYIIGLINSTSIEYELFLKNIRNGNLNRKEINQEFKYFSMKLTTLDTTINNFLNIKNSNFQSLNRNIHKTITDSSEFNNTITNSKVKLKFTTLNLLNYNHKNWTLSVTNAVLNVNSK